MCAPSCLALQWTRIRRLLSASTPFRASLRACHNCAGFHLCTCEISRYCSATSQFRTHATATASITSDNSWHSVRTHRYQSTIANAESHREYHIPGFGQQAYAFSRPQRVAIGRLLPNRKDRLIRSPPHFRRRVQTHTKIWRIFSRHGRPCNEHNRVIGYLANFLTTRRASEHSSRRKGSLTERVCVVTFCCMTHAFSQGQERDAG